MTQELFKPDAIARIEEEAEKRLPDILKESMAVALAAQVPFVGEGIKEMLTQLSFRRTHERMRDMYEEMGQRIDEIGEEKIDKEFFKSEQFQTLLFEALRQLHTTHDKQKIEMLGRALANSGSTDFRNEDRKELFVQLVREFTPQHFALLTRLAPHPTKVVGNLSERTVAEAVLWHNRAIITPSGDEMPLAQMLSGNGLLNEILVMKEARLPSITNRSSFNEIDRELKNYVKELQRPPIRSFSLSELGRDFLKFVGLD